MAKEKHTDKVKEIDFSAPEYYTNRELSWIKFDERVLGEARDKSNPLFERIKFLSITASNLDEFFMVRVASLKDMENAGYVKPDIAGLNPTAQLEAISPATHELIELQYSTYNRSLLPLLRQNGLNVIESHEDLNPEQEEFVDRYFQDTVYPVLTPMAVDSSRPFPLIRNKSLNIAALITEKTGEGMTGGRLLKKNKSRKTSRIPVEFAMVQVPGVLPRIVQIPSETEGISVILLEQIIERNIDKLFLNYSVICAYPFRVMRNADLTIDEEEAEDLLKEIEKQLKRRQWGQVRVEFYSR